MKETDIEQLAREQLQGAEIQPPDSVWDTLQERMANEPATAAGSSSKGKRWSHRVVLWTAVATVALAAATVMVHTFAHHQQQPEMVAQNNEDQDISTAAETPSLQTEAVQPVAQTPEPATTTNSATIGKANAAVAPVTETAATPAIPTGKSDDKAPAAIVDNAKPQPVATAAPAAVAQVSPTPSKPDPTTNATSPDAVKNSMEPATTATPSAADTLNRQFNIIIPNLITPNGDGYNDCWAIPGIEQYTQVNVQIFNAQSKRVYANNHYTNNFCGDDIPDGNYFYILVINEKNFTRRGVLVIKR